MMLQRSLPLCLLALSTVPLAQGECAGCDPASEDQALDTIAGAHVRLASFPVRPMCFGPGGSLWAVNHHDSTLVRFDPAGGTTGTSYPVPWDPVSVAHWHDTETSRDFAVVVCRGSWAVALVDMLTGDTTEVIQLRQPLVSLPQPCAFTPMAGPSGEGAELPDPVFPDFGQMAEPGDVLVDPAPTRPHAYVSCMGSDSVIRIDLRAASVDRVYRHNGLNYNFRVKSPLFLSWDKSEPGAWRVLVAPLHSGNNTAADAPERAEGGFNVNGPSPADAGEAVVELTSANGYLTGLPDEDLFLIDPVGDCVSPVRTAQGTILFGQGTNPATQAHWQLNTDALNAPTPTPPANQSELGIRGIFSENRLTISTGSGLTPQFVPLTFPGPNGGVVGQPYGLTFAEEASGPSFGRAFIAGVLSDNVAILEPDGSLVSFLELSDGTIPRATLLASDAAPDDTLYVYCWGTNEIRRFAWGSSTTPSAIYDLGHDPTPAAVARGREIFFDGDRSLNGDVSCATCHVEGGLDFLTWNLQASPLELKGPMATQSTTGLRRLGPFHWRGERDLRDFNGAFVGLLGDDVLLTEPELDDLVAYFFSLSSPANPRQNRFRFTDDAIELNEDTAGFPATVGEVEFNTLHHFFGTTCEHCHSTPTGTDNDIIQDFPGLSRPARSSLKPAPFTEIWRRDQPVVPLQLASGFTRPSALLGTSNSHGGIVSNLHEFIQQVNGFSDDEQSRITNFVIQWDSGLPKAVHFAYHLDQDNTSSAVTHAELEDFLMVRARAGDCDVVVYGLTRVAGNLVPRRWTWDRRDDTSRPGVPDAFHCEDPGVAPRAVIDFRRAALNHGESHTFLGVPRGSGWRIGIDHDLDGVPNLTDGAPLDPTVPGASDTDAPDFVALPDIAWRTKSAARLTFETDELTTAVIDVQEVGDPSSAFQVTSPHPSRDHAVMLTGLRPSTFTPTGAISPIVSETVVYEVTVAVLDVAGNPPMTAPAAVLFRTDDFSRTTAPNHWNPSNVPDPNGRHLLMHESVEVASLMVAPLTVIDTSTRRLTVTADIDYVRGPRGTDAEAADHAVIGRVLFLRCTGDGPADCLTYEETDAADWSPGFRCLQVDRVITTADRPGTPSYDPAVDDNLLDRGYVTGPYVIARTGLTGKATFAVDVDVSTLDAFDRIVFDVDLVLKPRDLDQWDEAVADVVSGATSDLLLWTTRSRPSAWSVPYTGEENMTVSSEKVF